MSETLSLPNVWTKIAFRPRSNFAQLVWTEVEDAPISIVTAHALARKGMIFMANHHTPDQVELLVRPKVPGAPAHTGRA